LPFAPQTALRKPADAENGTLESEAALRTFLRGHRQPGPPSNGWRLLAETETTADFAQGYIADGTFEQALFKNVGGVWEDRWLGPCPLPTAHDGRRAVTWTLAGPKPPTPSSRTIEVDLGPAECASGMPESEQLEAPVFRQENGALLMTLWLRPLPPGWYSCQAVEGPPTKIELPGRLGHRELLDGGVFPPQSPIGREL
jgi:hypothetical protein